MLQYCSGNGLFSLRVDDFEAKICNLFNISQNEFILPSLKIFANACSASWIDTDDIVRAIRSSC